jgi:hypothetical protein
MVDDGSEPGAESGVRDNFEEVAVVGEPQVLRGAEVGNLACKGDRRSAGAGACMSVSEQYRQYATE